MATTNLEKRALMLEEDEQQLRQELQDHDARKHELRTQLKQVQAALRALRPETSGPVTKLRIEAIVDFVGCELQVAGGSLALSELKTRFRDHVRDATGSARGSHKRLDRALEDARFQISGENVQLVSRP